MVLFVINVLNNCYYVLINENKLPAMGLSKDLFW